jgi:hypothetical protein
MTISATYAPDTYAGNGSLDTYAITFNFLSTSTNVKVSIKVDSTGVVTEKTAATHYNVSGSNVVFTGGNIPASGETILIELNPSFKQESDYAENSALPAETLEADLDLRTLEAQINRDQSDRSIKFDSTVDLSSFTNTLSATTASKFIQINSAGTGWTLSDDTSIIGGLAKTDGNFYVGDGTTVVAESGATARTSIGLGTGNSPQFTGLTLTGNFTFNGTAYTAATGSDTTLVSGTAGTTNYTAKWDANGDLIDGYALSGLDGIIISGTAGTSGDLAVWNADGDLIDGPTPPTGTIIGTSDTQTLTNKTLTSPVITQVVSTGNDDIDISPAGTGNVQLGTVTLDGDMTVGAGQDNYVLKYDNGSGLISLEAEAAGGIADVVDDTTPQLGGDLDLNGNQITSPDGTDLINIPNGSIDLQTASTSRLDISDTGVRLGAANARVTTILDEDAMGTDSPTALATQQSIKAYVDSHGGAAKFWVHLQGTGTAAVRDSYNVTSITDNGTGDYTVTIADDFSADTYAVAGMGQRNSAGNNNAFCSIRGDTTYSGSFLVGSIRVACVTDSGSAVDPLTFTVIGFGD